MIEDYADLWEVDCDARCITTNGTVKSNGRGVMGRGCARQAKHKYVGLEITLGAQLKVHGNHVAILCRTGDTDRPIPLIMFPVKRDWWEHADLQLIAYSAEELVALTDREGWKRVVLPRPGCGNGGRSWEREVRHLIQPILDDRFRVVTK